MFLVVSLLLMGIILTYVISKIAWANIDRVEKKQAKQQQQSQENKTEERDYE